MLDLNVKLDAITSRLDALTDLVTNQHVRVELPATTQLRGAPAHDELQDDADNGPRQPRYDPRQAVAARVPPADRGRAGLAARVPLDDGFGRVKITIPP